MFFSRWFSRKVRPARAAYKPVVFELEDRALPSGFHPSFSQPHPITPPGPATHLQVVVPQDVQAGRAFEVEVEALDASSHLATGYTGTVQISLATSDLGATLPANYTFTTKDHGEHEFFVTLSVTGSQTILANDTALNSTIIGSAVTTVAAAPVATQIVVITPEQTSVGVPTNVTVVALDASGHRVTNYTGTVSLSALNASLPASYTFSTSDQGKHTFQVTFNQATTPEVVTATGTSTTNGTTSTITGQASLGVVVPGQVTQLEVFALGPAVVGTAMQIEVVALDASGNVVPGYTGTVHFTSSDTGATLPGDYQFLASDNGSHVFSVTFSALGCQTLTVADASAAITSSVHVKVKGTSQQGPGGVGSRHQDDR